MEKKIIILVSSIVTFGFALITRRCYRRYKQHQRIFNFAKSKQIAYTVAEANEILKENPNQNLIYIAGHLPQKYQESNLLKLQCFSNNRQKPTAQYCAKKIQILDHITKSERQELFLGQNTKILRDMMDTHKKYIYTKNEGKFQRFLSRIPLLKRAVSYEEQNQSSSFGKFVIALCEKKGSNLNALYVTSQSQEYIYECINRELFTFTYSLQVVYSAFFWITLLVLGITKIKEILDMRYNENKDLQPPVFQKSVSKILQSTNEEDICVICLTKLRSIIFEPCLHLAVCQDCVDQLQQNTCPLCRNKIEKKIKVIYS